jgi:hypothetical protein
MYVCMCVGGTSKAVNVAKSSDVVQFANVNQPLRPRVIPSGNTDVLNLVWSSAYSTQPILRWGKSHQLLNSVHYYYCYV